MKAYRIEAKLKNNRLWSTITRVFPRVRSQSDAARALRVGASELGTLCNMKRWPYSERDQRWWVIAVKVARRLRETPEFLFDGELYGRAPQPIVLELEPAQLAGMAMAALPPAPDELLEIEDRENVVQSALTSLTPRQQKVLSYRFGFEDGQEWTHDAVGKLMGVTRETIRMIEAKALRKLRHPALSKPLREFRTFLIEVPPLRHAYFSSDHPEKSLCGEELHRHRRGSARATWVAYNVTCVRCREMVAAREQAEAVKDALEEKKEIARLKAIVAQKAALELAEEQKREDAWTKICGIAQKRLSRLGVVPATQLTRLRVLSLAWWTGTGKPVRCYQEGVCDPKDAETCGRCQLLLSCLGHDLTRKKKR